MYFGELSELLKYVIMLSESLLVVVLSVAFFLLIHKTPFGKLKWIYQQVIIGVVFGGAAIFGTEMGIDIGTSIINVRDAAPVTAGLLFGGPAGMVAAFIGSLWRLISTYAFNKGEYAMLACCIATLVAGAYAWALRKWFFEEKAPNFLFGFATAAIMEVIHFIILYLTHLRDPQTVLNIIYEITAVMIIANGVGVSLACLAIGLLDNGFSWKIFKSRERTINSRIQLHLLLIILVTAYMSTSFVTIIQNNYANETANESLDANIDDLSVYINEQTDAEMEITTAYAAKAFINSEDPDYNHRLQTIKEKYPQITHLNIVAYDTKDGHEAGDILYSTDATSIGLNVRNESADDLMSINYGIMDNTIYNDDGQVVFPRRYEQNFYNSDLYGEKVKIGTLALVDMGSINAYIQIVSNVEDFFTKSRAVYDGTAEDDVNGIINELTKHRRVYLTGFMVVLDRNGNVVSYYYPEAVNPLNLSLDDVGYENGFNAYTMYSKTIYGAESYYAYDTYETYYVISVIPRTDVTDGRNMMIIVYSFMLIFIYASIFFVTYILMKQLVIKNLRKINNTLNLIMQGDLDQKVNVKSSQEFIDLSRDINITVDTLKDFIKEAEERIDKELAFARSIQASSLPSVFPAFPGVKEFDIYATMNTAKEVGGDFYDFYFVDMNHIAFLVADVSGKGIPASMFMMESKALIKNTLTAIKNIDILFNRVNESLSQGNEANMFVTCWMGILDLDTGVVEYVNAGHNAPVIYRASTGKWEYLKEEYKDLVLAGLPNTKYHKQSITLNPGDKIYLYTDGVTEATRGDKTLYGEQRLLAYLNKQKTFDQYKLLAGIQKDIDKFVSGADQFDDITMLVFDFKQTR